MTKEELKKAIEDRSKSIMEMLFHDSLSECFEDMLLDLKHMAKAKTFKQVCELQGRDYKEEIQILKKEQA